MSIRAIDWAFGQTCSSMAEKLVLIKLADNANDAGYCWPSMDYIAHHCGCSRRYVIDVIKKLEEANLIEVIHRNQDGIKLPNAYRIKISTKSDVNPASLVVNQGHGGSEPQFTTVVNPGSHKPSLNRNITKEEKPLKKAYPIPKEERQWWQNAKKEPPTVTGIQTLAAVLETFTSKGGVRH